MRITILFSVVLAASFLSACASTNTQAQKEPSQSIEAAKINMKLGIAYLQKGEMQRAKEKLLVAQSQAPRYPATWYAMAYFMEVTGEFERAKQMYRRAISIAPRQGAAHNNYGTFLCRHRQYDAAIKQFQIAVKDPRYLGIAEAYENMGICAGKIPDKRRARHYYKIALKQNGQLPTALLELTKLEMDAGRLDDANVYLQRYTMLLPETAESLWLQARMAYWQGDTKKAAHYGWKLRKQFPKSSYAHKRYTY